MSEQDPVRLVVGRVVKPHGVQGEFVVDVRTDSPELRFVAGSVLGVQRGARPRAGSSGTIVLTAARSHAGRLLVRAEEVHGREAAEALRGAFLTIGADELETVDDPDEFHDHQLEGLYVVRPDGAALGSVDAVVHTPGGELLQVRTGEGDEVLVPFVSDIVPQVNLTEHRVVVDPPEGLFD